MEATDWLVKEKETIHSSQGPPPPLFCFAAAVHSAARMTPGLGFTVDSVKTGPLYMSSAGLLSLTDNTPVLEPIQHPLVG